MGLALPAASAAGGLPPRPSAEGAAPDFAVAVGRGLAHQGAAAARARHARAVGGRRRRRGRAAAPLPDAQVEHFDEAGHSLQGDTPSRARAEHREVRLRLTSLPNMRRDCGTIRHCRRRNGGGSGGRYFKRSRKPTMASLKRSFRSPATMWPAPATSTYSACGTSSEQLLRTLLAQQVAHPAAHEQRGDRDVARRVLQPVRRCTSDERVSSGEPSLPDMKRGSQCQYPAAVLALADVLLAARTDRWGAAGAGCTRRSRRRPRRVTRSRSSRCSLMNAPMRMLAVLLDLRRDVDEHERRARPARRTRRSRPSTTMPPSDAPTSTGGSGSARGDARRRRRRRPRAP